MESPCPKFNEKQKNENILKRVSIYQIKTKHPMFSYADSTTYHFSWKRIKRGLYKSKNGIYINADVKSIYENLSIFIHTLPFIHFMYSWNGSYNIMRKEFPALFTKDTIKTFKIKPKKVNIL